MQKRVTPSIRLRLILALTVCTLSACNRAPDPRPVKLGTTPLAIEYKSVNQFEVNSIDTQSGARWSATFQSDRPGEPLSWKISAAPNGAVLSDRLADGTFIQHLLDTLGSLRIEALPGDSALGALGLDPPRTLIRYRSTTHSDEVRFGASIDGLSSRYAQLGPKGSDAASPPFVSRGATLKMLEYLTSFDILRRRTLLTYELDELDEVRLYRSGREVFFAERYGDEWVNKRKKVISEDAVRLMNHLVHLRIRTFEDQDPAIAGFSPAGAKPLFRAVLVPRTGSEGSIDFFPIKSGFIAILKERREGKFGLHAETELGLKRWPK